MTRDPFKSWRRIVESATRERPRRKRPQRGAPQRRPEPGAEARAVVADILGRKNLFRPLAAADWTRVELVAQSAAFLHFVEALVREDPWPSGAPQAFAEQVLNKLAAVGTAPESDAIDYHEVTEQAGKLAEHLEAAALIVTQLYGDHDAADPAREFRFIAYLYSELPPERWPAEAFWRLGRVGALAYVLRELAAAARVRPDVFLVSDARSDRSNRLPLWSRFGRRGGAADANGRLRGALARDIDRYIPLNAPGRLTTIAELLTVAGLPTTPENVRRLLTRH